jgi:hypothetical protein
MGLSLVGIGAMLLQEMDTPRSSLFLGVQRKDGRLKVDRLSPVRLKSVDVADAARQSVEMIRGKKERTRLPLFGQIRPIHPNARTWSSAATKLS